MDLISLKIIIAYPDRKKNTTTVSTSVMNKYREINMNIFQKKVLKKFRENDMHNLINKHQPFQFHEIFVITLNIYLKILRKIFKTYSRIGR